MPQALIVQDPTAGRSFRAVGNVRRFVASKAPEVICSGPAETGKSFGMLNKLNLLCAGFPGVRALLVRKTYASLKESAVAQFETKVVPEAIEHGLIRKVGGDNPKYFDYPNGSRIVLTGMDGAATGSRSMSKVLSAEYDYIAINQAEELSEDEYELLTTRCTGRAGNAPWPQVMGDCNPGHPLHWILKRRDAGSLELVATTHRDNPTLYDPDTGHITEQGRRSMAALDRLTGTRRLRLRDGLWVSAEGAVYPEFDPSKHVITRRDFGRAMQHQLGVQRSWRKFRVVDFGYTNPFVCQWWIQDPDDRLYRYREIYMTGRTVHEHAKDIVRLSEPDGDIEVTICDHDAEDRATLEAMGIKTVPAFKSIEHGLDAVRERLKTRGDGKPGLMLVAGALVEKDRELEEAKKPTCTEEEFPSYMIKEETKNGRVYEVPVAVNDHGLDDVRYLVAYVDNVRLSIGRRARRMPSRAYTNYTMRKR